MRRSASGSDELCLDVRLWPHSVAIADLMRLPLCAKSRHLGDPLHLLCQRPDDLARAFNEQSATRPRACRRTWPAAEPREVRAASDLGHTFGYCKQAMIGQQSRNACAPARDEGLPRGMGV